MAEAATKTQNVAGRESAEVQKRGSDTALRPPVDISEDPEGITLVADMPGVSRDRLNITVDKDMLLIEGEAQMDMADETEAFYADVRSTRYRRSFALSGELETAEVGASLKDGVLSIRIPKRAEIRPRRIEVRGD